MSWSWSTRYAFALAGLAALQLTALPARGADTGCASFLWPVAKEQAAFARADLAVLAAGSSGQPWGEQAFVLKLVPQPDAKLATAPSGAPHVTADETFAGTIAFNAPAEAGAYHVTLSGPAWIDIVQDGTQLPAAAHTGVPDCPDVRKSVRFELKAAPLTLQISGAVKDTLKIAIVPAVD